MAPAASPAGPVAGGRGLPLLTALGGVAGAMLAAFRFFASFAFSDTSP